MGKFYELFEMDAHVGAKELDLQYMKVFSQFECTQMLLFYREVDKISWSELCLFCKLFVDI